MILIKKIFVQVRLHFFSMFLLCKFKNGVLWFCESTNNVFWVTNNSVSWLFRLSSESPTMDGSGDAHEWFDEKQKVEERTLWYIRRFYSTSPARNLTGLAQTETPEFMPCNTYKDMQGSGCSDATLCFAFAIFHKAMGAVYWIGWLWTIHSV